MKNFTRSKLCILLVATLFVNCSGGEDSTQSDTEIPPTVIVDPNNPNNPEFPTVDSTKLVVFETSNLSVGTVASTSAVITNNYTVVITSTISPSINISLNIIKVGVCYSTTNSLPSVTDTNIDGVIDKEKSKFAIKLTNLDLTNNKKYYARTYVVTSNGVIIYGDSVSLTTTKLVENSTYSYLDKFSTIVSGKTISNSLEPSILKMGGICWSETNTLPTKEDQKITTTTNLTSEFKLGLFPLKPNTLYYYRAFVENSTGIFYANEVSTFRTVAIPSYEILILGVVPTKVLGSNNPALSVYFAVNSSNNELVKEVGVCMSKTRGITIENTVDIKKIELSQIISYPDNLYRNNFSFGNLIPQTKYYFRAYIKTSSKTHYSTEIEMKTGDNY